MPHIGLTTMGTIARFGCFTSRVAMKKKTLSVQYTVHWRMVGNRWLLVGNRWQ